MQQKKNVKKGGFKMRIEASKRLATELQKELKKDANFKNYRVMQTGLSIKAFGWYCDIDHKYFNSDITKDGKIKTLVIVYPYENYANNLYLSSFMLQELAKKSGCNWLKFVQEFKNRIEV